MPSDESRLLTRDEFIAARDEIALDDMRKRGRKLQPKLTAAWKEVQRLKKWVAILDRFPAQAGLQYGLDKEKFDYRMRIINVREKVLSRLDGVYREWGAIEAEISAIARDPRYMAWKAAKEAKKPIEVIANGGSDANLPKEFVA